MSRKSPETDTMIRLSVRSISASSSRNLGLPLVTVGEQLLLVVEELLTGLGGVLGIGSCEKEIWLARHTNMGIFGAI